MSFLIKNMNNKNPRIIKNLIKKNHSELTPNNSLYLNKGSLLMKNFKMFLLLPALAVISCSEDSIEDYEVLEGNENQLEISSEDITERANPGTPGEVSEVYFAGKKLPVESFEGEYVYQGDILFSRDMVTSEDVKLVYEEGETPSEQKSVGRTSGRWPNNTVYYAVDGGLSNQQRVVDAIKHWEAKTNLTFVKRSFEKNYIYFTTGSGCASYVGMIGGRQNITLSSACSTGNTIHEIGHAIGLWHEQSRVDRDKHITIHYENVQQGTEHNFTTYADEGYDGDEYTSSLDFGSVMLYSSYSFSKNGLPTITKTNGSTFSVQRSGLSSGDIEGINGMYPSSGSTEKPSQPTYINGEYYTIAGLTVLRFYDKWYYSGRYGMRAVYLKNGVWYYR
jgi:hypothetical protein